MSILAHRRGFTRPGFGTLTAGLLLVTTIGAIAALDSQIEVFGFGDAGPDARSFPRAALWLLAAVLTLRLIRNLRVPDAAFGGPSRLGRAMAVAVGTAVALWAMPQVGFLIGASGLGILVALLLGERRILLLALPVAVAALVTYGGRHGLNIPLP